MAFTEDGRFVLSAKMEHAEQREDEVYFGNFTHGDFSKVGWKTKRRGVQAYLADGTPYQGETRPVFIQLRELTAAGVEVLDIPELPR